MKSIRLKNLRSFEDTGYIKTEGLTVIVGENSVGKSTILRSLPLIKQSIETKTTSPLLWYGDYVDFGSFKESLNRNSKDSRIGFTFKLDLPVGARRYRYNRIIHREYFDNVNIELYVNGKEKSDYIDEIRLTIIDNIIDIQIDSKGRVVRGVINGEDVTDLMKGYIFINPRRGIIPEIYEDDDNVEYGYGYGYGRRYVDNTFMKELKNLIKSKVHTNTSDKKIYDIITYLRVTNMSLFKKNLLESGVELNSWSKFLKNQLSNEYISKIRNLYIGSIFNEILRLISDSLNIFSDNIYYIAPVRANANRYYRNQNLSVDSVDFQGMNLPMLLANLSQTNKKEFSNWVYENFGFEVNTKMNEGHISINIKRENEIVNMVDCGFGYSQILPIITQLWLLTKRRNFGHNLTLIIEQPELHLHPKMQGNLIDLFAKCVNSSNLNINIIIETHSETIINRLGYLIYDKKISKENVNVYILNKNGKTSIVEKSSYDNNGTLENWPLDFFNLEAL